MKRNVITALSLTAVLLCGTTTAFAQEIQAPVAENPSAEAPFPLCRNGIWLTAESLTSAKKTASSNPSLPKMCRIRQ